MIVPEQPQVHLVVKSCCQALVEVTLFALPSPNSESEGASSPAVVVAAIKRHFIKSFRLQKNPG